MRNLSAELELLNNHLIKYVILIQSNRIILFSQFYLNTIQDIMDTEPIKMDKSLISVFDSSKRKKKRGMDDLK